MKHAEEKLAQRLCELGYLEQPASERTEENEQTVEGRTLIQVQGQQLSEIIIEERNH